VPRKDRASTATKPPPGVIGSRKGLTASMPATASADILPTQRTATTSAAAAVGTGGVSSLTALLTSSAPAVPVSSAARPLVNPWAISDDDDDQDFHRHHHANGDDEEYGHRHHHHHHGGGASSLFAAGGFGPFAVGAGAGGSGDYYPSTGEPISASSIFAPQTGPFSAFSTSAAAHTWGAPAAHHPHHPHHHSGAALPVVSSLFSLPAPLVPSPPASSSSSSSVSAPTQVPSGRPAKRPLRSPPGLSSPPIAIHDPSAAQPQQERRLRPYYDDLDGGLEYDNNGLDGALEGDEADELDMDGGGDNYDPFLSPSASFFSSGGMASHGSPSSSFFSFAGAGLSSSPTSSPSLEPASTPSYDLFASHPLGFGRRPPTSASDVAASSSSSATTSLASALSGSAAVGSQPTSAQQTLRQQQMNRKESYDSYFAAFDVAPLAPHHHQRHGHGLHHHQHSGTLMTINSMHMAVAADLDGEELSLDSYDSRTSSIDSLATNPDSLSFDLIDERDHHHHHHPGAYYHDVDNDDDEEDTTFP
jgi:hypothetical protein